MKQTTSAELLISSCRKIIGRHIVKLNETHSTNTWLLENITPYTTEGLTVTAKKQLSGRGRHGKTWQSGDNRHLFCSIALQPKISRSYLATISLIMGVGILRGISSMGISSACLKWPNDILINNKKVCGILSEIKQLNQNTWVVVGFGLNVKGNSSQFHKDIASNTTTIEESANKAFELEETLDIILSELDNLYELFQKTGEYRIILNEWIEKSCTIGKRVSITTGDPSHPDVIYGYAIGLDKYGGLILHLDNGTKTTIYSGTLRHL